MRSEHLEYFLKLAETNSITKTSQELYTTHQNVSKMIRQLEEDLKTTLFIRTQKGMELTPSGKLLLPLAERTFGEFKILRNHIISLNSKKDISGKLHIYTSNTSGHTALTKLTRIFMELHPNLQVYLERLDTHQVLQAVAADPEAVGIATILANPEFESLYEPLIHEISCTKVSQDAWCCAVNIDSSLASLKSISLTEFAKHPFATIATDPTGNNVQTKLIQKYGGKGITFSTNDIHALSEILEDSSYVVLSSHSVRLRNSKNKNDLIVAIPFQEDMRVDISIVTHKTPRLSEASQAFFDFIQTSYMYQ